MVKLNMANMNVLFKKGYLLAGVIMATNMFVANEVEAMDNNNNDATVKDVKIEVEDAKNQSSLDKLLSWENYFNFFGTLALSGFNNYFKWWDYNPGGYLKLRIGCLGWRTKKFFDIVQLDFNLNLWRGIGWSIPHFIKFRRSLTKTKIEDNTENNEAGKIETTNEKGGEIKSGSNADSLVSFLFKDILRGFVSIPLTFYISNFSISISFDSILWEFVIGRVFNTDEKGGKKKIKAEEELKDISQNA